MSSAAPRRPPPAPPAAAPRAAAAPPYAIENDRSTAPSLASFGGGGPRRADGSDSSTPDCESAAARVVHDGIAQIDEEGDGRVSSSASDVQRLSASDYDGCEADDCARRGAFGWLCIASGHSRDIDASEHGVTAPTSPTNK